MDKWPQRDRFKALMKAYQEKEGLTQEQVAERLGISLDHMRNTLYRKGKRMGVDILARAAALFGCSTSEFVEDPGGRPDWLSSLSETSRAQFDAMARAWGGDDLSDEERTILFNRILTEKSQIIAMREQIRRMNRK